MNWPGIEPGSHWWEVSVLIAQPPRVPCRVTVPRLLPEHLTSLSACANQRHENNVCCVAESRAVLQRLVCYLNIRRRCQPAPTSGMKIKNRCKTASAR
ncbi:hypothetical protein PR048_026590 [Dryococelus australis]|uniref:Uncharacterized protein n=1 Tax=Dryococelus australis TaxID=614101 RepID=A0ABQ9GLR3_9NEOP|nr:hypothetical protein PR048_026590 [Dryococelus australis]